MRSLVLALAATTALVLVAGHLTDQHAAGGASAVTLSGPVTGAAPTVGKPAPDFTATAVDGTPVSLSSFRGRAVWLTFGASWCAACRAEAPDIEAAYRRTQADGVVVLAVSISESTADVRGFADRAGLTFPQVADPDTRIASAYRVGGIPAHFFIDRHGVLRSMRTGSLSPDGMDGALVEISR
ncbi:MAG: TlpA family protein disulfide reductase [Actinobacteria bacterium]|nr:TlpA family protein disulfide reductase [Actinomycetota bacterium]MBI3686876.1 TlpA family protein disulfide reductase [Actinomycetota bacterium]